MTNENEKFDLIKKLVASGKGQFVGVTFTKKNGEERVMQVQPAAAKFHVKGENASEAMQRAVKTRAAHNPNLLNVWDVRNKGFRSINMETVSRVAVGGKIHEF